AREMLALGRWSVPKFNGLPYLDKPALFFWLMAAVFRVLGTGEPAARLPAAVGALATIALTFAIGRLLFPGRRHALLAGLIVASTPLVIAFGRLAIFDMPFTALVTAALFCLLRARLAGGDRLWLPLAGLAMGLATLTKGPVGLAVPLVAWWAGRGALPASARPARLAGLAAVVPVGLLAAAGIVADRGRGTAAVRLFAALAALVGAAAAGAALARWLPESRTLAAVTPAVLGPAGLLLLVWGGLTLVVGGRRPALAVAACAVLAPAMGLALLGPLGPYAESRSSRALAARIEPGAPGMCFETFRTGLPFY